MRTLGQGLLAGLPMISRKARQKSIQMPKPFPGGGGAWPSNSQSRFYFCVGRIALKEAQHPAVSAG